MVANPLGSYRITLENTILPPDQTRQDDLRVIVSLAGSGPAILSDIPTLHFEVNPQSDDKAIVLRFFRDTKEEYQKHFPQTAFANGISSTDILTPNQHLFTVWVQATAYFSAPLTINPPTGSLPGRNLYLSPIGWYCGVWYDGPLAISQGEALLSYLPPGYYKRLGSILKDQNDEAIEALSFAHTYRNPFPTLRQSLLRAIASARPTNDLTFSVDDPSLLTALSIILATMSFENAPRKAFLAPGLPKEGKSRIRKLLHSLGYQLLSKQPTLETLFDLSFIKSLIQDTWVNGLCTDIHEPTQMLHGYVKDFSATTEP